MSFPHEVNDIQNWAARLGCGNTVPSADIRRRMGKVFRLVQPALNQLAGWIGSPVERAVFEGIRFVAFRFHERVTERYLKIQDRLPREAVSVAGLFLLRLLEKDREVTDQVREQLCLALGRVADPHDPPAILDGKKSAELDVFYGELRRDEWLKPSFFGDTRRELPVESQAIGEWVKLGFLELFGSRKEVAGKNREELAMAVVDESSPELVEALGMFEAAGWKKGILLTFLLREVVDQPGWLAIRKQYETQFEGGFGESDPIVSLSGRLTFSAELERTLAEAHTSLRMWGDADFIFEAGPALDVACRWGDPSLGRVYLWLAGQAGWEGKKFGSRPLPPANSRERLAGSCRLVAGGYQALFGPEAAQKFERDFTNGLEGGRSAGWSRTPDTLASGFDPELSDGDLGIYVDAMNWIGKVQRHLGVTDPHLLTEGADLADAEVRGPEVRELVRKIRRDEGLQLDFGGLLHWAAIEGREAASRFVENYRESTGRQGWFDEGSVPSDVPFRRISQARATRRSGWWPDSTEKTGESK